MAVTKLIPLSSRSCIARRWPAGLAALFKMNLLSGWCSMSRPRDRISCAVVVESASMVPNVTGRVC